MNKNENQTGTAADKRTAADDITSASLVQNGRNCGLKLTLELQRLSLCSLVVMLAGNVECMASKPRTKL